MSKHTLISRSLATSLVIGAASVPAAAQAQPDMNLGPAAPPVSVAPAVGVNSVPQATFLSSAPSVQHRLDQLQSRVQQRFAAEGGWPAAGSSARLTSNTQPGFQWGDAGIGAGGAVVVLAAAALGMGLTRRHRMHGAAIS